MADLYTPVMQKVATVVSKGIPLSSYRSTLTSTRKGLYIHVRLYGLVDACLRLTFSSVNVNLHHLVHSRIEWNGMKTSIPVSNLEMCLGSFLKFVLYFQPRLHWCDSFLEG